MKYAPLIWSALWRKPLEAVLTWLAVTAAFALFGVMLGVNATLQAAVDGAPSDILFVWAPFSGVRLQEGMREQIARVPGVSAIGTLYQLSGYRADARNPAYVVTVDEGARRTMPEYALESAQWDRLLSTPDGIYVSRRAASHWNLEDGDTFTVTTQPGLRADGSTFWSFHVLGVVPDAPDGGSNGYLLGNYHYIDQSRPPQDRGLDVNFRVRVADSAMALEVGRRIDRIFVNSGTPTRSIPERVAYQIMASTGGAGGGKLITSTVSGAGLFMILLLIASGLAQSVRERVAEFAVLETFGFRDIHIMGLVFGEAAIPCMAGAVVGTSLAMMLAQWPAGYLPEDFSGLPKPTLSSSVLLWAVGFGALLACACSVLPLLRVRRMSVVSELSGL